METNYAKRGLTVTTILLFLALTAYCITWKSTAYLDLHSGSLRFESEAFGVVYRRSDRHSGFSQYVASNKLAAGKPYFMRYSKSDFLDIVSGHSCGLTTYGGAISDLEYAWIIMENCDCDQPTRKQFVKELLVALRWDPSHLGQMVEAMSDEICLIN